MTTLMSADQRPAARVAGRAVIRVVAIMLSVLVVGLVAIAVGSTVPSRMGASSGWILLAAVPVLLVVGLIVASGPRACLAVIVLTAIFGWNAHASGGSHSFRIIDVFWLALVGWALQVRARRGPILGRAVGQRQLALFLLALLVSLYPVAVYTPSGFGNAFISWARLAETMSLVWLVPYAVRRIEDIEYIFGVIEAGLVVTILVAVEHAAATGALGERLSGGAADTTGLLAALLVGASVHAPVPRRKALRVALFVLGVTALFMTRSVGSLAAAGIVLAVFGFRSVRTRSPHGWLLTPARVVLLVLAVAALATTLRPGSLPSSNGFRQSTTLNRTVIAAAGLDLFRDNPVLGVGWTRGPYEMGSGKIISQLRTQFGPSLRADFLPTAENGSGSLHNTYVEILAEAGIVGFVFLLIALFAGFRGIRAVIHSVAGDRRVLTCAWCAAALLVGVVVWLNDNALFGTQPETVLAATFLGMLAATPHLRAEHVTSEA